MQKTGTDHTQQWQPPPRPEWLQRINEEGACMNISGIVPLDEKSLLESAMRSTGLSDFGVEDWREPFQALVKSLNEDADLHLMGRIRVRSEILNLLEARLQIEDTYKRHPEIDNEEIIQPILIVGQGRSGTSFLHNVLAANPDNGVPTYWEAMFPCPPPERATYHSGDPRIEKGHKLIDIWNRVTPTMTAMHEWAGQMPSECTHILSFTFMSSLCATFGRVTSYGIYQATHDMEPAFRYHKRVLKLLQWKNPRKHWVLKDPFHLDRLATILKVYPDACFVWPHRDPVRALASVVNLVGTMLWGFCDEPFKGGSLMDYMTDPFMSAARFNTAIDQLEAGVVPPKQFYNLLYRDLVGDTMATLEAMHRHFGIPLSEEGRRGMANYLANNPRDARPPHKYDIGSDDAVARARQAYKRYQDYFNVPTE